MWPRPDKALYIEQSDQEAKMGASAAGSVERVRESDGEVFVRF